MHPMMTRREFLKTTGVAGTALAGGDLAQVDRPSSTAARPGARLKKAVKLGMVREDLPLTGKFRLLKEIGYDGVELNSPNDFPRDDVLRARDESGLPIHGVVDSVHWDKTLSDPDPGVRAEGLAALRTALNDAKAYGASTVLLVPAVVNAAVPYDAAYRRSQEEIRKVLPLAQELRIRIAIENVGNAFLLSPLEMARYIDEFESEWMGAYFDIGNSVAVGWPEQWIRILAHRILKVDVKDRLRKQQFDAKGNRITARLGDGDCDWPAIRRALAEIKYEGWATAELPGGDADWLRDVARRMDRVLAG